jgi:hypothetical protein
MSVVGILEASDVLAARLAWTWPAGWPPSHPYLEANGRQVGRVRRKHQARFMLRDGDLAAKRRWRPGLGSHRSRTGNLVRFSAQACCPGEKSGEAADPGESSADHGRPHGPVRHGRGGVDTWGESATPVVCIDLADGGQLGGAGPLTSPRLQSSDQQPARLQGHADSFGNHRMSFTSGIADTKDAWC